MHWFWRATIAVGVGSLFGAANFYRAYLAGSGGDRLGRMTERIYDVLRMLGSVLPGYRLYCFLLASGPIVFSFAIYGILTKHYGLKILDSETRCRKCGYILRGISEPRCPECGERI